MRDAIKNLARGCGGIHLLRLEPAQREGSRFGSATSPGKGHEIGRAATGAGYSQFVNKLGVEHGADDVGNHLRMPRRVTRRRGRADQRTPIQCSAESSALLLPARARHHRSRTPRPRSLCSRRGGRRTLQAFSGGIFCAIRRCSRMYIISPPKFITVSGIPKSAIRPSPLHLLTSHSSAHEPHELWCT